MEPDDSDYKVKLEKNIHNIIKGKIEEENTSVKEQLELLFENIHITYMKFKKLKELLKYLNKYNL